MSDRRSTDKRAKRSGIKIEKNWAENGALWNLQVRGAEGELCGEIPTVDVRDERQTANLQLTNCKECRIH